MQKKVPSAAVIEETILSLSLLYEPSAVTSPFILLRLPQQLT